MEVRPTSAIVQLARRRSSDGGDASHESERSFDIGLCIAPFVSNQAFNSSLGDEK